jgi:hypothetical protein
MAVVQQDTFARANQTGGWGTASDGEAWSLASGSSSNVQILSDEDYIYTSGTSSVTAVLLLGSATVLDPEGLVRFSVHDGAHGTGRVVLRAVDGSNFYALGYTTTDLLSIAKVVAGTLSSLASTSFTPTADTYYWLRARCTGNWLYLKVWQDGSSQPSA